MFVFIVYFFTFMVPVAFLITMIAEWIDGRGFFNMASASTGSIIVYAYFVLFVPIILLFTVIL